MKEINTHDLIITFGKHNGQRVTRLPPSYLKWAIAENVDRVIDTSDGMVCFADVAKAEMKRRGIRIETFDVSAHAIDRLSTRAWKSFEAREDKNLGLFSWAQKVAQDYYEAHKDELEPTEEGTVKFRAASVKWVVDVSLAIPVVKTVF